MDLAYIGSPDVQSWLPPLAGFAPSTFLNISISTRWRHCAAPLSRILCQGRVCQILCHAHSHTHTHTGRRTHLCFPAHTGGDPAGKRWGAVARRIAMSWSTPQSVCACSSAAILPRACRACVEGRTGQFLDRCYPEHGVCGGFTQPRSSPQLARACVQGVCGSTCALAGGTVGY